MEKILLKIRKVFFVFWWAILALIYVTALAELLYQKEYVLLAILTAVVSAMLSLSIWVYREFVAVATDFKISGDQISFVYDKCVDTIGLNELSAIGISCTRYIFYGSKKHIVMRYYRIYKEQDEVDPRIYDIAAICQIPCVEKFI